LHDLLGYLGDSIEYEKESPNVKSPLASQPSSFPGIGIPSEALVRWQLRLEYFAYETLQDLRIGKLFEIIVDYPDRFAFLICTTITFRMLQIVPIICYVIVDNPSYL
jgi:hypothetical protein